jgi:hypothetical protein
MSWPSTRNSAGNSNKCRLSHLAGLKFDDCWR